MVASIQSPADIVNLALSRSGKTERVGNLFDGSEFAKRSLDTYAQTRDALLREADWGFPRRDVTLTLLKQAPGGGYVPGIAPWNPAANPPRPYWYEYAYPTDCILLRAIRPPDMFIPNFYPLPQNFEIANDAVPVTGQNTAPGRVILCYLQSAIATYCGQVTDMTQWDIGFVEALANEMARFFAAGAPQRQGQQAAQEMAFPGAVEPVHTPLRLG
jgi:hypothetical protein